MQVVNELEACTEPIPVSKITVMPIEGGLRIDMDTLQVGNERLLIQALHMSNGFIRHFQFSPWIIIRGKSL